MAKSKKTAAKAATKSAHAEKAGAKPSKSAFIRQHSGKKPAEIVELAKKVGLSFKPEYVYTIRQADKKSKGSTSKAKGHRGGASKIGSAANHYDRALKDLVLTHGVDGAKRMLDEIVRELRSK